MSIAATAQGRARQRPAWPAQLEQILQCQTLTKVHGFGRQSRAANGPMPED